VNGHISTSTAAPDVAEHWNGRTWTNVPLKSLPGPDSSGLSGVADISAASVWAVGCTDGCFNEGNPQIERWNGTSWKQNAAPVTPSAIYALSGVAATSASNVWAVGGGGAVTFESAAIAHWNGHAWKLYPGITRALLAGVAATSPDNA
jgi:hypothetical protein